MKKVFRQISIVILAITITLLGTRELEKVMAQSSAPCLESEIILRGGNGNGSGSGVRRFTTVSINVGSDITYADNSTDGATLTINSSGIYSISYTDGNATTGSSGISNIMNVTVNDDEPNFASSLCYEEGTISNTSGTLVETCSNTTILSSGDVLRAFSGHNDSLIGGLARLTVIKLK
jgi:hypothetical protein